MHSAQRRRDRNRDTQEMRYLHWPAKQPIERRTAGILQHQRHAAVVVRQRDRSRRPVRIGSFGSARGSLLPDPSGLNALPLDHLVEQSASVPMLTDDSQIGSDVRVWVDEDDRTDFDQQR
jgi:hypothetical protein